MCISRDEMTSFVKGRISEKRYIHSLNTAKEAVALARKYGADENKAYIAGLLHDVAKGLPASSLEYIAKVNGIPVDEYELSNPELMHGKIGAAIVSRELDIKDEEILSAIKWHTTGHKNMTLLEKIIYLADIIEPGRNFPETEALRAIAYKDLNEAMLKGLWHVMSFVKEKGLTLHPNSVEAYENIKNMEEKKKLGV
jgi:predicted HD superfamily hydrolase involved in NAD metabolism